MTGLLPKVIADDVIRALKRIGFFFSRQDGSYKIFKNKVTAMLRIGK
jgi:predicted RNA binding protein YcfA (HicA-like mRNA interferase family)